MYLGGTRLKLSEPVIDFDIPASMPKGGNRFTRFLGRVLLRSIGWKLRGALPNEPKVIVAAAPHTSNWDFIIAMGTIMSLGLSISYLMKKEAFIWPLKGFFLWLGGIPIDRKASGDTVEQISNWYSTHEKVWVVLTPEGTRSKVDKWKTGFLRIAEQANIPIFIVAWDYPSKTLNLLPCWKTTGDHAADAQAIRDMINEKYIAKYPEKQ